MKWVLIILGAVVVYSFLSRQSQSTGTGFLGLGSNTKTGVTGFVDSLTGLTNSLGKLFGSSTSSAKSDGYGIGALSV